jgi:hypothetical protein
VKYYYYYWNKAAQPHFGRSCEDTNNTYYLLRSMKCYLLACIGPGCVSSLPWPGCVRLWNDRSFIGFHWFSLIFVDCHWFSLYRCVTLCVAIMSLLYCCMLCGEVGGETTKANKRNGEGRTGWLVCGANLVHRTPSFLPSFKQASKPAASKPASLAPQTNQPVRPSPFLLFAFVVSPPTSPHNIQQYNSDIIATHNVTQRYNENQWQSTKINENQWKPMKLRSFQSLTHPGQGRLLTHPGPMQASR